MFNKVLFLGPHADDECGCSATLARFLEENLEVFVAIFSFCEESVPTGFEKDVLRSEFGKASQVIGINKENIFKYNFKVRHFPRDRQKILEELIILKDKIKPDLVLLPTLADIHQDHHTVAEEGIRAFNKNSSIFGYELPQNITSFINTGFIEIKNRHLDIKINSLRCYKSQAHREYVTKEFLKGLAKIRGIQAGVKIAEGFEVIKLRILA